MRTVDLEDRIFSEKYLLERPLLAAIRRPRPPVLLIDEIDRADEEFEAFLLELLSDFQVSIPELGTIKAVSIPHVVLTSNGTRELSDALRRRCLYHYVDFPGSRPRGPHHHGAHAGMRRRAVAADRPHGGARPQGRSAQGAWRCRDARLGGGAGRASTSQIFMMRPEAVHDTLMCLLKTHEDSVADDARGDRPHSGKGRVSCVGAKAESDRASTLLAERLAGFIRTLRERHFTVGLREGQDAAAILAAGYGDAARSSALGFQASVLAPAKPIGTSLTASSMLSGSGSARDRG